MSKVTQPLTSYFPWCPRGSLPPPPIRASQTSPLSFPPSSLILPMGLHPIPSNGLSPRSTDHKLKLICYLLMNSFKVVSENLLLKHLQEYLFSLVPSCSFHQNLLPKNANNWINYRNLVRRRRSWHSPPFAYTKKV